MLKRAVSTVLVCTIFTLSGISQIRYVSQIVGTPAGDGLSWFTASNDLQAMLNDVPDGGTIRLEAGIYTPNAYPAGCVGCTYNRDFAFYASKNLFIEGGYSGGSATPVQAAHSTILSGDIGALGTNSDNTHHVLLSKNRVWLRNLSVRYGKANAGGSITVDSIEYLRNNGAGVYVVDGSLYMIGTILSNNEAANQGGGFFAKNSYMNMSRCAIISNSASQGGGVFFINDNYQQALIEKSVIANNVSSQGGAMFLSDPPRAVPSYYEY
nr:hypothetical protein [Saprospiraceae bacterium]